MFLYYLLIVFNLYIRCINCADSSVVYHVPPNVIVTVLSFNVYYTLFLSTCQAFSSSCYNYLQSLHFFALLRHIEVHH